MPFTPIHLGPGLAFKALGGRYFSFMVFGGSQVLIDIEPLIGILQRNPILHGYTHTLVGALLIGIAAGITGKPISNFVLRLLHIPHHPITWMVSFVSAFVGTFSHLIFDGIMHGDATAVAASARQSALGNHFPRVAAFTVYVAGCAGALGIRRAGEFSARG